MKTSLIAVLFVLFFVSFISFTSAHVELLLQGFWTGNVSISGQASFEADILFTGPVFMVSLTGLQEYGYFYLYDEEDEGSLANPAKIDLYLNINSYTYDNGNVVSTTSSVKSFEAIYFLQLSPTPGGAKSLKLGLMNDGSRPSSFDTADIIDNLSSAPDVANDPALTGAFLGTIESVSSPDFEGFVAVNFQNGYNSFFTFEKNSTSEVFKQIGLGYFVTDQVSTPNVLTLNQTINGEHLEIEAIYETSNPITGQTKLILGEDMMNLQNAPESFNSSSLIVTLSSMDSTLSNVFAGLWIGLTLGSEPVEVTFAENQFVSKTNTSVTAGVFFANSSNTPATLDIAGVHVELFENGTVKSVDQMYILGIYQIVGGNMTVAQFSDCFQGRPTSFTESGIILTNLEYQGSDSSSGQASGSGNNNSGQASGSDNNSGEDSGSGNFASSNSVVSLFTILSTLFVAFLLF